MSITPKLQKPLEQLTKLEKERALRKLHGETSELIDEIGQESDKKAAPIVKQYVKEQMEAAKEQMHLDTAMLIKYSNSLKEYQRYLISVLYRHVKDENIPSNYSLYVDSSDKGILLGITGTEYYSAFKISGIPLYDLNACKIIAVRLGNTIGKMEGNLSTTSSGIIVDSTQAIDLALKYGTRKQRIKKNEGRDN